MIYKLLLTSETATKDALVFANTADYHSYESRLGNLAPLDSPPRSLHPAVLRTYRMIRYEAKPILYQRNKFVFTNTRSAHAVRRYADCEMTPFLTHVTLKLNAYRPRYEFRSRTFIEDFPNSKKLEIIFVIPSPSGWYDPPTRILVVERRGLRTLLKDMVDDLRGIKTTLVATNGFARDKNGEVFRLLSALVEVYMELVYKGNGHEDHKIKIWKAIEEHMIRSTQ